MRTLLFMFNAFANIVAGGDIRFIEIARRIKNAKKLVVTSFYGKGLCVRKGLLADFYITTKEKYVKNVFCTYIIRIINAIRIPVEDVDVVYATSDFLPDVLPAIIYKHKNRDIKLVQVIHHLISPPSRRQGSLVNNAVSYLSQRLSLFLIKRFFSLIIVVNPKIKRDLEKQGFHNKRLKLCFNGTSLKHLRELASHPSKSYDAVFLGRLHPSKGIFALLRIWKKVCHEKKGAKLGIIGTAPSNILKKLTGKMEENNLESNIEILGYLDGNEPFRIMKGSKVFVFPSYEEGWGMAIAEAIACGLPAVVWDLAVYHENYPKGIIRVPLGNFQRYADEVLQLLADQQQRERICRKGLEVISKYDWDKIVEREKTIIESL